MHLVETDAQHNRFKRLVNRLLAEQRHGREAGLFVLRQRLIEAAEQLGAVPFYASVSAGPAITHAP
jgi:hypothetical protein